MKKHAITGGSGTIYDSAKSLSRALFRGDLLDAQIRELPPQNLYFALKHAGLESCQEILSTITRKQYRALLDFELWTRDSFREERFWAWLGVIDDPSDLVSLQRCIDSLDPDLLALLVKRYIEVEYHEEKDDPPPGPNYYSPDQGKTWIAFKTHDPDRHRLLGKLLAFLYQTNANLFYQTLLTAFEGTTMEFEESAYQGRSQRLASEYIPVSSDAADMHVQGSLDELRRKISNIALQKTTDVHEAGVYPVVPLFVRGAGFQPMRSMLEQYADERLYEVQSEFSRILNAAVVFFLGDFAEVDSLTLLTEQVFGAVNIGMQVIQEHDPEHFSSDIISCIAVSDFYKVGLGELYALRKRARKIPEDILQTLAHMNPPLSVLLEFLARPLPVLPSFFREDGTFEIEDEKVSLEPKAISSLEQITAISRIIEDQIENKFFEIRSYEKQSGKHQVVKESTTKDLQ
jgi:hypothetical protein